MYLIKSILENPKKCIAFANPLPSAKSIDSYESDPNGTLQCYSKYSCIIHLQNIDSCVKTYKYKECDMHAHV